MVEDIFRSMKSLLETRPIYHKRDETIRGHVFCSFLALVLRKELQDRLDVSPDGKSVVFGASNTRGELGVCDLPACTTVRTVTTLQGGPISRWTPDGKGIAFYDVGRGGNLWVQPLDGSAPKQLTHFADNRTIGDFAWSRDGKRLAIARFTVTNDIVLFKGLRR